MSAEDDKRLAAEAAVAEVRDGMTVGLGTGSTAAFAISALAHRVATGLKVQAVATSKATARAAQSAGIEVIDFADCPAVDIAIDGTDEIDERFWAIKGAGGAMLREKAVAAAARRFIVIADGSKRVARIGAAKLPVEVLPFARSFVVTKLAALGAAVSIRPDYRTDNENLVADCRFQSMADPRALAAQIMSIPGVLGHGLFLDEVDATYIAARGTVARLERDERSD
ncbi:ribose-5-phosphate isomerase RpiA [Sphingomonas sp. IC4-52]|uniref:ribose-5-phosphate isomerase RpiA n=1 Tax=Sphingomonas sp. IC4-52 TaxID=2887202 RepID=UPI001D10B81C|nr:ribose-5-phosphate isomerase RpiA [Sphingomonas sp. IC4-52]MCC2979750.1 ribose-5-phosphate isomerase RpiA [Sphingomonas sp. IC4-52]